MLPGVRVVLNAERKKGFQGPLITVGDHLKARRLTLGKYQKDVARELGVDHWTLVNWETGRTEPTISAYPAIIAWLGYDPHPHPHTLPEHLKAYRRRNGWSINQAARNLDVDPTSWGGWEQGGTVLLREHRQRLAALLGLDPTVLDEDMRRLWKATHA